MQTILADSLNMQRGIASDVKHLNAVQFKLEKNRRINNTYALKKHMQKEILEQKKLIDKLQVENEALKPSKKTNKTPKIRLKM